MRCNRADRPLTHARQTLQVLSEMARKGSVTAAVALKRVLRSDDPAGDFDDELARILSK